MRNRAAFFYIIIVLALLAVVGLVFLLAPGNDPDTPAVLLPAPVPASTAADPGTAPAEADILAVTPETVQAAIATLQRPDAYSRTLQVRDFWSGGSRGRSISMWVQGDALRLSVQTEGSSISQQLLLRGGEQWIWYSDDPAVFRSAAREENADAYQSIITYEKVLELPVSDILDADYRSFGDLPCIFVRFRSGELGYESECLIDPATGLLMAEYCYDGETLLYSMESSLPELSVPDESVFSAP